MAARVGRIDEGRNSRAEAAAHLLDELGIVGLAETVGVGIIALRAAQPDGCLDRLAAHHSI
jgi:hypothetical protein